MRLSSPERGDRFHRLSGDFSWMDDPASLAASGEQVRDDAQNLHIRGKMYELGEPEFIVRRPKNYRAYPDQGYVRHVYTEFGAAVCALVCVRVAFNPGELADFFLGFFRIDIMMDDVNVPGGPQFTIPVSEFEN